MILIYSEITQIYEKNLYQVILIKVGVSYRFFMKNNWR